MPASCPVTHDNVYPPRNPAPLRTENGESSSLRPVVTSTGALSIAILKDVLDSTDALPVVKAVAGVGIKIIEVVNVRPYLVASLALCEPFTDSEIQLILLRPLGATNRHSRIWLYVLRT